MSTTNLTPFEYYGQTANLETAKEFLTELHKAGLSYHPDDSADDCLDGHTDRATRTRIQSMMDDAYNAFNEAGEEIHAFIMELDPDHVAQAIKNRLEEQSQLVFECDGRDMCADENRQMGELTREIERLEKLQSDRGQTAAKWSDMPAKMLERKAEVVAAVALTELRIQGRTRAEFLTYLREKVKTAQGSHKDDLSDAIEWLELS